MQLLFFCPQWGHKHLDIQVYAKQVKEAGYDGIEMSLPLEDDDRQRTLDALNDHDLTLVAQHWETRTTNWIEHKTTYEKHIRNLAKGQPFLINSHTGRDFFTIEQNTELINLARSISQETGIPILHETHRGRFSFAAHVTRSYLEAIEDLYLALDLSHWCAVAETLLEDQTETVELALTRGRYFHARVGHDQGPQIVDPRAPEYESQVKLFLTWWDRLFELAQQRGDKVFPICPEFGPAPYLQHLPFTQMPITSQWDINCYMKDLLKERFSGKK